MKKRGISLIVLIITIIVVIILAAVVILTISKNNPIESAKEATFKEDVRNFQHELAMYISKDYTARAGARDDKITATNYEPEGDSASVYTYIPSFKSKYNGKFVIKNDELMYSEDKLTEEEEKWCKDINIKANVKTGAEKAAEDPKSYYGYKVNYKTGNDSVDNDIKEWRIFYSDGKNLYIISSEYINPNYLPEKEGLKPDNVNLSSVPKAAKFNDVLLKYNGLEEMKDERIKAFNSDYYAHNFNSGDNINMKAVAYILDKDIWSSVLSNKTVADYAVGGPSIEMILKSYSQLFDVDYRAKATSEIGYQISNDAGKENTWSNYCIEMLRSDSFYVLPKTKGADSMWVASPSYGDTSNIIYVNYNGSVSATYYTSNSGIYSGFRPIVCLNSSVILTEGTDGYDYNISN